MLKYIISLAVLIPCESALFSVTRDSLILSDHVFSDNIKTVQLHKDGWNLSYPVLKKNSSEKLILSFDLLKAKPETFCYTFIHCSKDWQRTDIFQTDYLEGYNDNDIEDVKPSFNTSVSYIHYRLVFPNDKVSLKLSGNYILLVYPAGEPDEPIITRRFIITEDAAKTEVNIHRPQMTNNNNEKQQVDFTVNITGLSLNDPQRNIFASILQNGRWDISRNDLRPDFYGNNELKYSSISDRNIFQGGNEYRYFDIKSLKYKSEYINMIDYEGSGYHILLHPSENREFKPYFYSKDFNGKYYIASQEGRDPDTDADYVYVYFTLPSINPLQDGEVYINGALTNWSVNSNNRMKYNFVKKQYESVLFLKQGWYNYEYVHISGRSPEAIPTSFESSHYETENDYLVIIYYRNPRERSDRVLSTVTANTLSRKND
jgi:hypothetical protein